MGVGCLGVDRRADDDGACGCVGEVLLCREEGYAAGGLKS